MKIVKLYATGGFVVRTIIMDGELEKIKSEIDVELDINISAAREHVGEIERYHKTLKERYRCVLSNMRPIGSNAYQYLHKQIVIRLVYFCIMMLNSVPAAKGISDRFVPREIVTGRRLNLKHIKTGFGDYIEASSDEIVTNDMKGRTLGCVSLGPSGNWQGSQVCFDLKTGRVLLRRVIKVLPMPDSVIKVINDWGKSQTNADFKNKLEFWDRLKQKYDWENDDLDTDNGKVEEELVSPFTEIPAEILGVRLETHAQPDTGAIQAPPVPTMSDIAKIASANAGLAPTTGVSQPTGVRSTGVVDSTNNSDDDNVTIGVPKVEVEYIPTEGVIIEEETKPVMTGQSYPVRQGLNNLCYRGNRYTLDKVVPSNTIPYKVGVLNLNTNTQLQLETPDEGWRDDDSLTEYLLGVVLVQQYNLKKGLELFGDRAEEGTTKELQ